MPRRPSERPVLGWREWLALPDLGIDQIKAKVDTGARTSALHAHGVHRFSRAGRDWVRFRVHPLQRNARLTIEAEAELVDRRLVRSSSGQQQMRFVIRTTIVLSDRSWPIELTLVRRDLMGFRMLLGRQAIRRRFLVDPGRSFLVSPREPRA